VLADELLDIYTIQLRLEANLKKVGLNSKSQILMHYSHPMSMYTKERLILINTLNKYHI